MKKKYFQSKILKGIIQARVAVPFVGTVTYGTQFTKFGDSLGE